MNDAPEHATNRLATLIEHLREYGSILDVLGDALEKGEATRFRQDVLNPVTEAATQGNPRLVIPALVAGLSFTYSRLTIRQHPTTAEREKLRDRLIQFEQELQDLPPPKTRWLSGNVDPHLVVTSEVRKLIADCRAAFTRLAVPLPSGMSKRLERLQTLEASIRSVLETAPTDWPPAAPLRVESLAQWASEPFAQSLAQLQDALFEALLGRGDVAQTALTAADRLIGLACPDPVRLAWLDRALVLLRGWGSGVGVRFLPENWSFSDPPAVGTLDPDEVESIPVYRQDIPQGMPVRVKVLGVVHEGQILRPAVVPVSAGPVPAGLAELEGELHELSGSIAETLRERLKSWRTASLTGVFESTAVDTFVAFWDEMSPAFQDEHPGQFGVIAEKFAQIMQASLGYTLLEPHNFLEHPDGWIQIAEGRLTSGRVRRVLRPGLSDTAGKLRIPARVEVE